MRELLKIDDRKAAKLMSGAEEVCRIINNAVIPAIRLVGAVPDIVNVWAVYDDPEKLTDVCIHAIEKNFASMNEALQNLTRQHAERKAREATDGRAWEPVPGNYKTYVNIQGEAARVDRKAVNEACAVYIEGAAVGKMRLHKAIAEQLTELFAKVEPLNLNAYFEYQGGKFRARDTDYNALAGIWE